jgi:ATP-binding cassette subfamily C protein
MRNSAVSAQPIRDLEQIRAFMSSQGPIALIDIPWLPMFLLLIFLLHPLLGLLATVGAIVLAVLAILTEVRSRTPTKVASESVVARQDFGEAAQRNAEIVSSLGLSRRMTNKWEEHCQIVQRDQVAAVEISGTLSSVSRVFRMVLQSALLGLGAYVVILGEATGGVIIAGAIMASRALAPIEIAIANWRSFMNARQSYERLCKVLAHIPEEQTRLCLPRPQIDLSVEELYITAPGEQQPIVHNITFALRAGDGLGIIGHSASGKSTLARALVGVWPSTRGTIRLDGATLDQFDSEALGNDIGYLPQDIELFEGTVGNNVARFDPSTSSDKIIAAARAAGAHEMILHLPDGYDTRIGVGGARLSAGQRQRIALARALYGDPFLIVLDEPNSNLDAEGETALTGAIAAARQRGAVVIVIAHRPAALAAVNLVAVMANGQLRAFGPKEEVMAKAIQPVSALAPAYAPAPATMAHSQERTEMHSGGQVL